ncbi:hypothetical protein NED98_23000, partial [Sphingomonas sp. MMSM20]|uniref:hypothetical protein n=1 Tax=Sphingomonas lycopersici TaxID=2951807 RepID=UPI0022380239
FARSMARMWTSVICSSFAWHLPVPVRHHTTPLEGGIHPISSVGMLLYLLPNGPDPKWGWIFPLGIWAVMFLSGYVSKIIEFRRWLRKNLTSLELPPTKPLSVPKDPD